MIPVCDKHLNFSHSIHSQLQPTQKNTGHLDSSLSPYGLCEDDLIPIKMHMHAANNNGIQILSAVTLRFKGRSPFRQVLKPAIVYVTSDAKLFLREEVCTALRMISKNLSG